MNIAFDSAMVGEEFIAQDQEETQSIENVIGESMLFIGPTSSLVELFHVQITTLIFRDRISSFLQI